MSSFPGPVTPGRAWRPAGETRSVSWFWLPVLPAAPRAPQQAQRVIPLIGGPLLHRDDPIVGDLDPGRADLGAALGDVAQAQPLPLAQHRAPVPGIQRVHVQLGVPDEIARSGVDGHVLLVVPDHVADVLAQPALDALAELLAAVDVGLGHPV